MGTETYWVYVLRNLAGKFYIGLTEDVTRRLSDHNAGLSRWTKKFRPWELVWRQGPMTLGEARRLGYRGMQFNAVVAANKAAIGLWESMGFEAVGTVPRAFRHPDEGLVPILVMYRDL